MDVRRVVTGHDIDDNAVFVSDELVAPVTIDLLPGTEFHQIWGADKRVSFPDDGARPSTTPYFPALDGFRFGFFTIPPRSQGPAPQRDANALHAEFEEKLPGMADYFETDAPGMHTTATVDCGVVVSGEVILELDNKQRVTLRPGDAYIQNGTRHRWSNWGDVPAVIAVTLIGANRRNV